jgi:hypothetical protein
MTLTALKGIGWPCIDRRAAQDAEKTYIAAPTARRARDAATERGRSRRSASVRGGGVAHPHHRTGGAAPGKHGLVWRHRGSIHGATPATAFPPLPGRVHLRSANQR